MSPVTFYFSPATVTATSRIAARVRGPNGLNEAATALEETGLQTEFETECQRLDALRIEDESYDEIISELINIYEAEELTLFKPE